MIYYRIVVSYNGQKYKGLTSKSQKGTVAEKLYEVMSRMTKESIDIDFAIDVERGAHGRKIPGKFSLNRKIKSLGGFRRECQSHLPKSITIDEISVVDEKYQAKHNVKSITDTMYFCRNLKDESIMFMQPKPLEVKDKIDVDAIKSRISELEGQHDFISFSDKKKVKNSIKTVETITINDNGNLVEISITANSFIKGMGRNLHRMLLNIGLTKNAVDDIWSMNDEKFGVKEINLTRVIEVEEK